MFDREERGKGEGAAPAAHESAGESEAAQPPKKRRRSGRGRAAQPPERSARGEAKSRGGEPPTRGERGAERVRKRIRRGVQEGGGAAAIGRGKRGREAREEGGAAARKQAEPQAAVSLFLLGAFFINQSSP